MEEPPGGHPAAEADEVTRFTAQTIAAREARASAWILIAVGVGCILFGGMFFAAKHNGNDVVATVTHEGPCSNGACTLDVVYNAAGTQVTAVMYGVPSDEIYGPASRRLLNINYDSGDESDPTTNDMPDGVWIGFGAAGLAFAGWGAWWRLRRKASPRKLAVAAAGGAPASAAVTAAVAPGLAGQPVSGGPERISGRGPGWVSDESGAVTIAERYPRWSVIIVTLAVATVSAFIFLPLLARTHVLAAAYLVVAAAVSIGGCSRGWRIGLRLGDDGVMVRNLRPTYRIGWPEVACFADGSVNGFADGSVNDGNAAGLWALGIALTLLAPNRARERRQPRCGRHLPNHSRNGTTPQAGPGGPGSCSLPGWA
jgi:hypothetical protein